jgi:hypothetical protein
MDGQQIYDNFHTHAIGTGHLQAAQDGARQAAQVFQDQADDVQRLMNSIADGWTGNSADQATAAMTPLAVNSFEAGDDLAKAQDLISRQIDSFHAASSKVMPLPPQPQLQDPLVALTTGQKLDPYLGQLGRYNAAAQHNVDAMNGYRSASNFNTTNLPPIHPALPVNAAPISLNTGGSATPVGGVGGGAAVHPPGVTGGAAPSGSAFHPSAPGGSSTPPPSGAPTPGSGGNAMPDPGRTVLSGAGQGTVDGPPRTVSPVDGPGGGVTAPPIETPFPPGVEPIGGFGGLPIGGSNGEIRAKLGGGNSAPIENSRNEKMPGGRGAVGGVGDESPGSRSGIGAPGAAAEEKALLARESAAARGGAGPAGMMGGHGAPGEKDTEHKRKYNYGEDPDDIFAGQLPKVAPPVVGETDAERVERYQREQ